jgi:small-conductance mechanosensitive channel
MMPVDRMFALLGAGWPASALAAGLSALGVLLFYQIVFSIGRRLARHLPLVANLLSRTRTLLRWTLVLVALQFVWEAAPEQLQLIGPVRHATSLALILSLTWLAARVIEVLTGAFTLSTTRADSLQARRLQTQAQVMSRVLVVFVMLIGVASALMTFPSVRQFGASLLASAGVAGLVVGLAARPVLGNVIAGIQLAFSQPIRLDDVLIVQGESGRVEEITAAFVVVRLWDDRRMVVPLQWFIENPFENWTRSSTQLLGTVLLWVDFRAPVASLRAELVRLCQAAPEWDGRVAQLQVSEVSDRAMQVRALVSAADSGRRWDLCCRVREGLIDYLVREHPDCLPRVRAWVEERQRPQELRAAMSFTPEETLTVRGTRINEPVSPM